MGLSTILLIIGIVCIVLSFFLKDSSKKMEQDLEELSISIYQETNALKKRLKVVEEELFLEPNFTVKSPAAIKQPMESKNTLFAEQLNKTSNVKVKQINEILVSQVIELNKQGYPIEEISKMSTLSKEQVLSILHNGGRR